MKKILQWLKDNKKAFAIIATTITTIVAGITELIDHIAGLF